MTLQLSGRIFLKDVSQMNTVELESKWMRSGHPTIYVFVSSQEKVYSALLTWTTHNKVLLQLHFSLQPRPAGSNSGLIRPAEG